MTFYLFHLFCTQNQLFNTKKIAFLLKAIIFVKDIKQYSFFKNYTIMRKTLHFYIIIAIMIIFTSKSFGQIRITEAMSNAGGTGIGDADWFELTNIGTSEISIIGWKMDDNSYVFANAVALNGVTSIPAGKSVIFIETATPETDIPAFKTFWGTSLDNIIIGSYTGSKVGLSSDGDGIAIYDAAGTEVNKVALAVATATVGKSFFWSYNSAGTAVDNGVVSSVGTINGTVSNQITITSTNALGNIGSPGTAIVLPLNANTINPSLKPWRLESRTLKFDVLPSQKVEVYSLTGLKVSSHNSAREIKLDLKQGIYIVKVDGKATKILIR